jgi:phosphate transport system substrate-binding protein
MKRILYFLAICLILPGCDVSSKENSPIEAFAITGSETMFPLLTNESKLFEQRNYNTNIEVIGGGSETGINALHLGKTSIAMSSRSLKIIERLAFQDEEKEIIEKIIAFDALAIIINRENKITQLTREQIEDIYSGKINNWKELGGENLQIVVFSREPSSGTFDFFNEFVLNNTKLHSRIERLPTNEALMSKVKETRAAICYVGLGYLNNQVKSVFVSYDKGISYIEPSQKNVQDQTYPIIRPLYLYYFQKDAIKLNPFIKFVLSHEGQELVLKSNYIPLRNFNKFIYRNILPPL